MQFSGRSVQHFDNASEIFAILHGIVNHKPEMSYGRDNCIICAARNRQSSSVSLTLKSYGSTKTQKKEKTDNNKLRQRKLRKAS